MGREASIVVRTATGLTNARVHLDSECIELRGGLRADLPFSGLGEVAVDGEWLLLHPASGPLALQLGAREADLWLRRILSPPTLADKLGLPAAAGAVAQLGPPDVELDELLAPYRAARPGVQISMYVVALHSEADLSALPQWLAPLPAGAAVWTVRAKGKLAPVKEAALRAVLAGAGWTANKTARFSIERSADRWHRRRG
jgi:hypothetical protein